MSELTACAETDLAVAKALKLPGAESTGLIGDCFVFVDGLARFFRPSADLNDAFLAAEKFGLFLPQRHGMCLACLAPGFENEDWQMLDECGEQVPNNGPFATPALAICAAILKLA